MDKALHSQKFKVPQCKRVCKGLTSCVIGHEISSAARVVLDFVLMLT